jgi:hypothetical protein
MTYITVDVELEEILPEFDSDDILKYVYYNIDVEEVLNQFDYDDIRKFLYQEVQDIVIEDADTLKDLLDPTCDPYLLKDFIQGIFKSQRGEDGTVQFKA